MKKILFLVNGYGLGNSTRIHGIIQHINQNYKFDIFGYGNSIQYFKQVPEVQNIFEIFPLKYGLKAGKIDFIRTTGKTFQNLQAIYKSRQYLKRILQKNTYEIIVSDSNFSAFFLKNRPKLISINNANRIIKQAFKIKKKAYLTSFLIEWIDSIYNKFIPDLVISPFFKEYKNTKKIKNTALIVRKEFLNQADQTESSSKEKKPKKALKLPKKHQVLIVTSAAASVNPKISLKQDKINYDISIVGDHNLTSKNIKRHNKTFNTSSLIKQSTVVVVNGGLSSISEALAAEKPMVVVPIKGHLEQKINADWIQQNNLGVLSSWSNLSESIKKIIDNYSFFKKHLAGCDGLNGAQQAGDLILKEIEHEIMR